ncbi:MAG: BofC C-terminal domain-containing protein [Bacillaceae bacterium]|nr:BofC C-terminal domain-containing protein [Bacillaceae bacterium]
MWRRRSGRRKTYKTLGGMIILLAAAGLAGGSWYLFDAAGARTPVPEVDMDVEQLVRQAEEREDAFRQVDASQTEITLKKVYVCGVESEQTVYGPPGADDETILQEYPDWQLVSREGNRVLLQQQINDISPLCKENGYFGLTPDQILALFDGPPGEENVIQTFYQIDTEKLESRLPREEIEKLYEGIRIRDLAEYYSILSTFGEYMLHQPGTLNQPES